MNDQKEDIKARLIKDTMTNLQSNEERMEELRSLMRGEKPDPVSFVKERSPSGEVEMPSPMELHQTLLKGVTESMEPKRLPELGPFSENTSSADGKKKVQRTDDVEG